MPPTSRRILLTGASGQVGSQLRPMLGRLGDVAAPTRAELNLTDTTATQRFVRQLQPHWIVNTAAYTAVDRAETEAETAFAVNAVAPRVLGQEAAKLGAPILHFSTDYVFAGVGSASWTETDSPAPLNVYGSSKFAGEQGLAASGAAYIIFRTSWVYGSTGTNFIRTVLRLAQEQEEIKVVADQHGAPTWSQDLARLIVYTMERTEQQLQDGQDLIEVITPLVGIYHACGAGHTTWFRFAEEILRQARLSEPNCNFAKLLPVTTAEYPTPAKRPLNSLLNCDKLKRRLNYAMPAWQDSVAAVVAQIQGQSNG